MKFFKIMFLFSIFVGSLFVLSACDKKKELNYSDFENLQIAKSEIFAQDFTVEEGQKEYYVYFYREDCPYCTSIKQELFKFINDNSKTKIFLVDTRKKGNEGLGSSNGINNIDGVTNFEELKLTAVPTLVKIKEVEILVENPTEDSAKEFQLTAVSYYQGVNEIKEVFNH